MTSLLLSVLIDVQTSLVKSSFSQRPVCCVFCVLLCIFVFVVLSIKIVSDMTVLSSDCRRPVE